ncbi:hypothetical protein M3647_21110 [Paenibacillus cellulositrophicus]|uniref:hypothetical protein n=1 Tax=Paenibacillus cellulositrophicus TaxID=562959 RepID=UPI00203C614A|nr:hypothetical protein [Paenibacillus cellulositrophicus]MCM2999978.1 hypothetical protein [Paenibacillus cellulositrophicus]
MSKNPRNHKQPWNSADQAKIEELAKQIEIREDLERIAEEKAAEFERTPTAVAKRIEDVKGWHYRQRKDK